MKSTLAPAPTPTEIPFNFNPDVLGIPGIDPVGTYTVPAELRHLDTPVAPGFSFDADPGFGLDAMMQSQLQFDTLTLDNTDTGGTRELTDKQLDALLSPRFAYTSIAAAVIAQQDIIRQSLVFEDDEENSDWPTPSPKLFVK